MEQSFRKAALAITQIQSQLRISCVNAGNGMAVAQSRLGRKGPRQTETINEAHIPI
jgi:hypothetical protein